MSGAAGRPRAVLDTSALVPFRLRRDLLLAVRQEAFEAVWSPWIIAELNRVLTWRWIGRHGGDLSPRNERSCAGAAKTLMALLPAFPLVHPLPPYPPAWDTLADVADHPIWAAAKVGAARYIVSEKGRDYPPASADGRHRHEEVEYLSGAVFLALLHGDIPP
jgi:hypothetical protein